jgi:RNA polymerase sigma-70 factor (ECF subfamily)
MNSRPAGRPSFEMTALTADERGLLAAAQAGDERAFRALVEPYRRALDVHAYRMLGSIHDAEDVLQETLLRAWSSLERFERRASIKTWLYRILTNACIDELERRPRRPEPVVDPYPDDRLPAEDPGERYLAREGMEIAFLTAIQRLPGRQRAVLILRDVLGWTSEEVAELLDSTGAAVNSALQRARATIEGGSRAVAPGATQRELLRRYVDAWEAADMDALVALLHEDAVMSMPPQASLVGAAAIGEFLHARREGRPALARWANGRPAVLIGEHRLLVLHVDGERVARIDVVSDPRVLRVFA